MLSSLIGSKTRRKLLVLLFASDKEFYVRQAARAVGEQPNAVRLELRRLERAGILKSRKEGVQIFYRADSSCPIYRELRGIVIKSEAFAGTLFDAFGKLAGVDFAFIYGSFAAGSQAPKSDIDVMLIGKPDMGALSSAASSAEKKLGRSVNCVVYPKAEFLQKKDSGFLANVIGSGRIWLRGDEDGFVGFVKGE